MCLEPQTIKETHNHKILSRLPPPPPPQFFYVNSENLRVLTPLAGISARRSIQEQTNGLYPAVSSQPVARLRAPPRPAR